MCSMCQHGVNKGRTWTCICGEINCRHIHECSCGWSMDYRPCCPSCVGTMNGRMVTEDENWICVACGYRIPKV